MNDSWVPAARERLKRRAESRPTKIMGQIRAVWPEIQTALANGQSQKDICQWLRDEDIHISPKALSVYLSRIRKNRNAAPSQSTSGITVSAVLSAELGDKPRDPLINLRERQQKRPGFHYDPEIKPEKLI
jgi:hypothetical protein